MDKIEVYGIKYKIPKVYLLDYTNLFVSEFNARTCYNSFNKSEHKEIQELINNINEGKEDFLPKEIDELNKKGSELLYQLSHVYFHESTLEHITLNFWIKDFSRGVLQELSRHRIASPSVQSTRYTLNEILNYFNIAYKTNNENYFIEKMLTINPFVFADEEFIILESKQIFDKLKSHLNRIGFDKFIKLSVPKSNIEKFNSTNDINELEQILFSKNKRNVGDPFKYIITDNFSVMEGFTINLRSLKNLLNLRLSDSAYWQFELLAFKIYELLLNNLPKYLELVENKNHKNIYKRIKEKIEKGVWE
jgi:thymidylate synthase (FAD)